MHVLDLVTLVNGRSYIVSYKFLCDKIFFIFENVNLYVTVLKLVTDNIIAQESEKLLFCLLGYM